MCNADETSWPWIECLNETINTLTYNIGELVFSTLNATNFGFDQEVQQKLSDTAKELLELLAFDDFQLQLLKVFLLTFVSTVALIFVAWHIYGPRISEHFMQTSSVPEDKSSSSDE